MPVGITDCIDWLCVVVFWVFIVSFQLVSCFEWYVACDTFTDMACVIKCITDYVCFASGKFHLMIFNDELYIS